MKHCKMSEKKNSKSKFVTILSKVAVQVGLFLAPLVLLLILIIVADILDIDDFDRNMFFLCPSLFYVVHVWIDECEKIKSKDIFFRLYFYVLLFASLIINLSQEHSLSDISPFHLIIHLPLLVSVIVRKLKKKEIYWQSWISIPIFLVAILTYGKESFGIIYTLTNDNVLFAIIYIYSFIGYTLYESYKNEDLIEMNCGIIANLILSYGFLITGVYDYHEVLLVNENFIIALFISLTILLIITDIYLYRKIRKKALAEKTPATIQA